MTPTTIHFSYFATYPLIAILLLVFLFLTARTALAVVVCYILSSALKRIPIHHRKQDPRMVWLLLVPLFPFVWNYFVFLPLARSFEDYFKSTGREEIPDSGWGMSLALCICADAILVAPLGLVAIISTLILMILVLVRVHHLTSMLPPASSEPEIMPHAPPPSKSFRSVQTGLAMLSLGWLEALGQYIYWHYFGGYKIGLYSPKADDAFALFQAIGLLGSLLICCGMWTLVAGCRRLFTGYALWYWGAGICSTIWMVGISLYAFVPGICFSFHWAAYWPAWDYVVPGAKLIDIAIYPFMIMLLAAMVRNPGLQRPRLAGRMFYGIAIISVWLAVLQIGNWLYLYVEHGVPLEIGGTIGVTLLLPIVKNLILPLAAIMAAMVGLSRKVPGCDERSSTAAI